MKVRRQVYLDEEDNRWLEEESKATGQPVSEIIRQAVHDSLTERSNGSDRESVDVEIRRHIQEAKNQQLPTRTGEALARAKVQIGSGGGESWVYDRLLDEDLDREIDEAMDAAERGS